MNTEEEQIAGEKLTELVSRQEQIAHVLEGVCARSSR